MSFALTVHSVRLAMNLRGILGAMAVSASALVAAASGSGCQVDPPPTQVKGQVRLTLLHTSDIHSRIFPYNLQLGQVDSGLGLGPSGSVVNVGGAARVSHIIGRERARSARVLHLDGGDCFQGAPVFNFFSGEAEMKTLSAMGTDAMIIANHEFDRGPVNLARQIQNFARFPVLAANYRFEDPSQLGANALGTVTQPFTVFTLDGLRVGVVGMGNLSSMTSIFDSPNKLGIQPLASAAVAQFYVDLLRPVVDVVVLVTHLGLEYDKKMIESTTGIDVVLGGHNHIVLQPPKRVRDCSAHYDDAKQSYYIELDNPDANSEAPVRRYCRPRDVILAHSGAFAKYVGRLDLVLSNDKTDFEAAEVPYDALNGFEVLTSEFTLFPVNETVPEDPIVRATLEPYAQGLESLSNLELLVGYALDGSRRFSSSGGDSPLGNMISTAMWLRLGIQTDFSLTNTTGIRADLVPGPVTVEQMFNVFPFDNSISKMNVSGFEIKELFDFVARRSSSRGCVSQAQVAGVRVVLNCGKQTSPDLPPGEATNVYIGVRDKKCVSDDDCGKDQVGACDESIGRCWQPIDPIASYELATSNYIAAGGSGFRVLQRNTTQFDTGVQQRDALIDYIRAGKPCGSDSHGNLTKCSSDADCADVGDGYVCACPEAVSDVGGACQTTANKSCGGKGACVLSKCRDDVAAFQRATCEDAPTAAVKKTCETTLEPCAAAGEQCKFLACLDHRLGNFSDNRLKMVGQ